MVKWCMVVQDNARVSPRDIYVQRVNAVMDHVESHLADDLQLERLAEVAQFSPFHFHRIFAATTGETLSRFINRVRLERSTVLMRQHPARALTQIAYECGFSSSSAFTRSFRERYQTTPSVWRARRHALSPNQTEEMTPPDVLLKQIEEPWSTPVQLVQLDPCEVGYVRHFGPFQGQSQIFTKMFSELYQWATPLGYVTDATLILAAYHDSPTLTSEEHLRVSACIEVPKEAKPSGAIGRMQMAGGLHAVGSFVLSPKDYEAAWNWMWGHWLPNSGYEPTDSPAFERYVNPSQTADSMDVEICIPVKAM